MRRSALVRRSVKRVRASSLRSSADRLAGNWTSLITFWLSVEREFSRAFLFGILRVGVGSARLYPFAGMVTHDWGNGGQSDPSEEGSQEE